MSTSLSPRSSGSSGHPTRQQLDELDALLQRMLALPVNQADEEVTAELDAPPKPSLAANPKGVSYRTAEYRARRAEAEEDAGPKSPPRLDAPHTAEDDKDDADSWVPLSSTWKPSPHTWKPLAQSWQQPRDLPPSTEPAQEMPAAREEPVVPPPPRPAPVRVEPKPLIAPPPEPQADAAPDLPGWQRPLVWFNVAFDLLLLPFGMPGRWLRCDGGGRPLLGSAGVMLLLAAAALGTMEWFGWTWEDVLARIR